MVSGLGRFLKSCSRCSAMLAPHSTTSAESCLPDISQVYTNALSRIHDSQGGVPRDPGCVS